MLPQLAREKKKVSPVVEEESRGCVAMATV